MLEKIANKEKIMGFGHRVYRTYDPRGKIFKKLAEGLAESKSNMQWYRTAESIEDTVFRELVEKKNKAIYPKVDFYSGVVYSYLEIPPSSQPQSLPLAGSRAGLPTAWNSTPTTGLFVRGQSM